MDVTEMDQKPTSSGVRNKQKQNKALAFRWKAVLWAAGAQARGWGKVGACSEDTAFGEAWGRQGARAAVAPFLPGMCPGRCPGGPATWAAVDADAGARQRRQGGEALTWWPRNG